MTGGYQQKSTQTREENVHDENDTNGRGDEEQSQRTIGNSDGKQNIVMITFNTTSERCQETVCNTLLYFYKIWLQHVDKVTYRKVSKSTTTTNWKSGFVSGSRLLAKRNQKTETIMLGWLLFE